MTKTMDNNLRVTAITIAARMRRANGKSTCADAVRQFCRQQQITLTARLARKLAHRVRHRLGHDYV